MKEANVSVSLLLIAEANSTALGILLHAAQVSMCGQVNRRIRQKTVSVSFTDEKDDLQLHTREEELVDDQVLHV